MKVAVAGGTGVVGRYVVSSLEASGHDTVVLSRSTGVDLTSGTGVADALRGADAVVDVTSKVTTSSSVSRRFFGTVTRTLLDAEREVGVPHHVALSIVGAARVNAGYFAGKRTQEDLVAASTGGWSVLRTTQFHEFAGQVLSSARLGPFSFVPIMQCRPIAAAEVGAALAALATGTPSGFVADLGGTETQNLADMARRYLAATGQRRRVLEAPLPGAWGRSMRDGSILPSAGSRVGVQTFEEWLAALPR